MVRDLTDFKNCLQQSTQAWHCFKGGCQIKPSGPQFTFFIFFFHKKSVLCSQYFMFLFHGKLEEKQTQYTFLKLMTDPDQLCVTPYRQVISTYFVVMQVWNQTQAELLSRFSLSIRLSLHNSFSLSPSLSSNCIPSQSTWLRRRTYSWQFHFFMKNLSLFFYFCPSLSEPLSLPLSLSFTPTLFYSFFLFLFPLPPSLSSLFLSPLFYTSHHLTQKSNKPTTTTDILTFHRSFL